MGLRGDTSTGAVTESAEDSMNSQRERGASMSQEAASNFVGDEESTSNGDSSNAAVRGAGLSDPNAKVVHEVLNSEIGIATLLNRLKQSIASAKEFSGFLKKRSILEEEHSTGLKKLCRTNTDIIRRSEHRHGSFLQSSEEITNIHERMADNGLQFASSLHQMSDDLLEMANNIDRNRKHWKTNGLASEQRVADTEHAMRKSKTKYDSLAEDYDRARTGDRQTGKVFGLKGPKSAAQHEEDLLRKVQAADGDYASKVQNAKSQRAELLSTLRPNAIKGLEELIKECDSALTMQMQKFASFNEKLLLSNGLTISPLKGSEASNQSRSLREVVAAIDNDKDLSSYITSHASKIPARSPEIEYQRAAVLNPSQQPPVASTPQRQSDPQASYASRQGPPQGPPQQYGAGPSQASFSSQAPPQSFGGAVQSPQHQQSMSMSQQYTQGPPPPPIQQHERSFSHSPSMPSYSQGSYGPQSRGTGNGAGPGQHYSSQSISSSGPPQLSTLPFQQTSTPPPAMQPQHQKPGPFSSSATMPNMNPQAPLKPVFGLSLEQLFERDGSAVPMVVYQCIQAVDLFGLEVEGIYRLSGTASHVTKIKSMFDNDASQVDFRDPAAFMHDVNSVAGLLKQFFRDLPDPLLTREHYSGFIEAAKNEDEIVRRDSLHAIINSLPDPNYATLRAVTLHLNRVLNNAPINRMNANNLSIVFGPTLMGQGDGNLQDAGYQVKVVDTILHNTFQIFDDDD